MLILPCHLSRRTLAACVRQTCPSLRYLHELRQPYQTIQRTEIEIKKKCHLSRRTLVACVRQTCPSLRYLHELRQPYQTIQRTEIKIKNNVIFLIELK